MRPDCAASATEKDNGWILGRDHEVAGPAHALTRGPQPRTTAQRGNVMIVVWTLIEELYRQGPGPTHGPPCLGWWLTVSKGRQPAQGVDAWDLPQPDHGAEAQAPYQPP